MSSRVASGQLGATAIPCNQLTSNQMGREALEGLHVSPKPAAIRQQENQQSDHFPSRYTAFFIELFFFLRILSQLICPALLRRGRTNRNGIGSNTLSPFRKHVRSSIQPSSHFQRTSLSCCHHDHRLLRPPSPPDLGIISNTQFFRLSNCAISCYNEEGTGQIT